MTERDLPLGLRDSAYRAETGEPAWPRHDAIEVIEWARGHRVAILGGEVWLATEPGPTIPSPHFYQWTVADLEGESWGEFVHRSARESSAYPETFNWADDDQVNRASEPYFNLVMTTEERR